MTPGARIQTAIELLGQILASWQSPRRIPADKLLEHYFKSHRYIGSKDRGAISELVYWVLRHLAELQWHVGEAADGRLLILAALVLRHEYDAAIFKDSRFSPTPPPEEEKRLLAIPHAPAPMPDYARLNYPQWLEETLRQRFSGDFEKAMLALNEQAPTDLRVNTLKTTREQLQRHLQQEGFDAAPTPHSPIGLRLKKRGPIFTSRYFKEGHFEVQDEGSQMVAALVDAQPGMRVIDFCAGAGGKTLAIAAAMQNKGRILAWDTSEKRLNQIVPRLRRAGVNNVQTHVLASEHDAFIKRHKGSADRVLVDAPCSGSGTWRRNPDLKWRFTPDDLAEVVAVQQSILASASRLVKPGGWLIYATCSILESENERQIAEFLKIRSNFKVVYGKIIWDKTSPVDEAAARKNAESSFLRLTPHQDGVDGFFAAVLERTREEPASEVCELDGE